MKSIYIIIMKQAVYLKYYFTISQIKMQQTVTCNSIICSLHWYRLNPLTVHGVGCDDPSGNTWESNSEVSLNGYISKTKNKNTIVKRRPRPTWLGFVWCCTISYVLCGADTTCFTIELFPAIIIEKKKSV